MKKIYLLLLIVMFPIYLFSQQDDEAELDLEISYQWDTVVNNWIPVSHSENIIDSLGNQIESISSQWDYDTNDWIGTWRYVYTFDANGNRTERIVFEWDNITNDWIGTWRYVYTFDANGNRIEDVTYDWDLDTNDWEVKRRYISTYDANGNRIEETNYDWDLDTNDWVAKRRYVSTYDANGNLTERIYYDWDLETNDWIATWRNDSTYDANGNLTERKGYEWDSETNDWIGIVRSVDTYDANGNLTERIDYEWETITNDWTGTGRYVSTYDSLGNQSEEIRYNLDSETNDSIGIWRSVHTYDANGNRIERIYYVWDTKTNDWIYREKTEYYWSIDLIRNQMYSVDENCSEGSILGTIITGSNYSQEHIQWSFTEGNPDHLFAIDSVAGDILMSQPGILDYETITSYSLYVEARFEDTTGIITDTARLMIYIGNVNDNDPVINDITFEIHEDIDSSKTIGNLSFSDADGDLNPLTLSILSGNENNIFKDFSPSEAGLYLVRYDSIDYEKQPFYTLTIQVSDGTYTDEAIITINVIDVDETSVGNIESRDPLKFYPNPAFDELRIEVPDLLSDGFDIVIIDLSGSVVYQGSGYIEIIDLSLFQKGVYFITIRSKDFVTTRKIIKH